MAKKKKGDIPESPKPNDAWEIITEMQINGRNVVKGTELKIEGERGRFRFIKYVKTEKGVEWIDVYGGPKKLECWRSFALDRVKTVHYKNKTDVHLAAEYKKKMKAKKAEAVDVSEDTNNS
jgi:hypothetical protein